jgi:hypothetical protein
MEIVGVCDDVIEIVGVHEGVSVGVGDREGDGVDDGVGVDVTGDNDGDGVADGDAVGEFDGRQPLKGSRGLVGVPVKLEKYAGIGTITVCARAIIAGGALPQHETVWAKETAQYELSPFVIKRNCPDGGVNDAEAPQQ